MLEKLGLVKLVEECGELQQVAAKKMTRMESDVHWDGQGSLKTRLEDEIADVIAAATIVRRNLRLDHRRILNRVADKEALFEKWMEEDDEDV
jgi:NTP pyrophosphatase (non-canonical NTP hydrolase)